MLPTDIPAWKRAHTRQEHDKAAEMAAWLRASATHALDRGDTQRSQMLAALSAQVTDSFLAPAGSHEFRAYVRDLLPTNLCALVPDAQPQATTTRGGIEVVRCGPAVALGFSEDGLGGGVALIGVRDGAFVFVTMPGPSARFAQQNPIDVDHFVEDFRTPDRGYPGSLEDAVREVVRHLFPVDERGEVVADILSALAEHA